VPAERHLTREKHPARKSLRQVGRRSRNPQSRPGTDASGKFVHAGGPDDGRVASCGNSGSVVIEPSQRATRADCFTTPTRHTPCTSDAAKMTASPYFLVRRSGCRRQGCSVEGGSRRVGGWGASSKWLAPAARLGSAANRVPPNSARPRLCDVPHGLVLDPAPGTDRATARPATPEQR